MTDDISFAFGGRPAPRLHGGNAVAGGNRQGLPGPDRATESRPERVLSPRSGSDDARSPRIGTAMGETARRAVRWTAWPGIDQGFAVDPRLAHPARVTRRRPRPGLDRGQPARRPSARERSGVPGQDDDTRIRLERRNRQPFDRHHPKPMESGPDAGRQQRRFLGSRRRRHGTAVAWHRRRWFVAHSGGVLWTVHHQTDGRTGAVLPADSLRQFRQHGSDRLDGRGCRTDVDGPERTRSA